MALMTATAPGQAQPSRNILQMVDWNAVGARIEVVADSLCLSQEEIEAATASEDGLLAFVEQHNQSLDWLLLGDMRPMLRSLARWNQRR